MGLGDEREAIDLGDSGGSSGGSASQCCCAIVMMDISDERLLRAW